MPPSVNDKTTPPAGALPKNLQLIVLGVIALLVVVASFFSGQSAKKAAPPANIPVGPNPNQLSTFTKMLENQRREMEEAKKQADALRLAQEQQQLLAQRVAPAYYGVPESPRTSSPPAVDPFEQKRREREETAPFASNIALRVAPAERSDQAGRQPNSSPAVQEVPKLASEVRQDPHPEVSGKNQGSGKYLPEKENGLYRIYEGTFIEAKLSNRLDGSFTGPVKCAVSKEVRSKTGDVLLIPKGSQVFGEAKRVDAAGQTRLAVSFKRLLLPNGYSINLDNVPGLSEQGETGLKDRTNNHYLRTLGMSGAVGLLGGLSLYGGRVGAAEYTNGVANAEGSSATTILNRYLNLLPTITIREGHDVNVYLSSDLQLPEYRP